MSTDALAGPGAVLTGRGGAFHVRQAREGDRAALAAMLARCTGQTRYRRFHGHVNAFPEPYLTEALAGSPVHFALVAYANPGPVLALASRRSVAPGVAELGVLVEDSSQRHGIGSCLLRLLIDHADMSRLTVLKATVLASQAWILPVLRAYGTCQAVTEDEVLDLTLHRRTRQDVLACLASRAQAGRI